MKLSYSTLLFAALALSAPAFAQTPIIFQAESATLTDRDPTDTNGPAVVRTTDGQVSGQTGPFVAMQGGILTLDISSVPRGQYRLSALYASPFGTKFEKLTVDGTSYGNSTECGSTFGFPTQTVFTSIDLAGTASPTVAVTGATGTLVVETCYGFTYFDTFTLTPVTAPPPATMTVTLQAESATLTDRDPTDTNGPAVVRTTDGQVSGQTGPFVAMQGGILTLDISSVPRGQYRLSALYASPFGTKFEKLTVDGTSYGNSTECGSTFGFPTQTVFTSIDLAGTASPTVAVTGATGTLVVETCYGFTYFDTFTFAPVTPVAAGETPTSSFEVVSVVPNPAAGRARISVQTGTPQDVSVRVYDVLGREVARLHEGPLSVGTATFDVETAGLAPGAYVIRVSGASAQAVRRFTVVR